MTIKSELDQYYTKPVVAKYFSDIIKSKFGESSFIEPSAGMGAFSCNFTDIKSYDLDPKFEGCEYQDFLKLEENLQGCVVVGNPPFGKCGSLAVKFINKCCQLNASAVCFILPKTFKKLKFQNKLNTHLHLEYEEDVEDNAFILEDSEYNVPCVFQIWVKKETLRAKFFVGENKWFKQVDKQIDCDIIVRRVGGRAGMVLPNDRIYSQSSTYFLKSLQQNTKQMFVSCYGEIKNMASNTAGVRSIGLDELQYVLDNKEKQNDI